MDAITLWTIYEKPLDYPDSFVLRRWRVLGDNRIVPDEGCFLTKTLEGARELIPQGLCNIGRYPCDDPAILEVWI